MELDEIFAPGIAVFHIISKLIYSFFRIRPSRGDDDRKLLRSFGYNQEVGRTLTLWSVFCLTFSAVGLLPSMAATLSFSLGLLLSIHDLLITDMLELEASFGAGSLRLL